MKDLVRERVRVEELPGCARAVCGRVVGDRVVSVCVKELGLKDAG